MNLTKQMFASELLFPVQQISNEINYKVNGINKRWQRFYIFLFHLV